MWRQEEEENVKSVGKDTPHMNVLTLLHSQSEKKNGTREQYDRSKILKGLLKACEKRAISREEIEQIVDDVETELRNADDIEIPSKKIGTIVIKKLRKKDKVAYVRFASVYKEFEDPSEFEKEVSKLMKKKS